MKVRVLISVGAVALAASIQTARSERPTLWDEFVKSGDTKEVREPSTRRPADIAQAPAPSGLSCTALREQGKLSGKGSCTTAKGYGYDGEFRNGLFNGRGVMTFKTGERYEGEFRDNKPNGRGVYTWPDGGRYQGEFRDGKLNGRGIMTYRNGARYDGEFRDSMPNGQGTYRAADSTTYSGAWTMGCYRQGNRSMAIGTTRKACGFQ